MTPYYDEDGIVIYHADCREALPELLAYETPALILTDPPYGLNHPTDYASRGRSSLGVKTDYAPVFGDDTGPDVLVLKECLSAAPSILWGANYYADQLPVTGSWLVWDKRVREGVGVNDQADGELAWSNATKGVRIFRHMWNGMWRDSERGEHHHPTQKPVSLMRWCIDKAKPDGMVFDPYMGAGPVAVAAKNAGLPYVGVEIEEAYCEIAVQRLAQGVLPLS
jgi:hypothetical protein